MGYYLNPEDIIDIYRRETVKPYFVDKTEMLNELIPLVEQQGSYISVTRPRRFGKSVVAAMIGSFFGKGVDSSEVFARLKVAGNEDYAKHLNQHNLIYIDFSRDVEECGSYKEYISTIKGRLFDDLKEAYPNARINKEDSIGATLRIVSQPEINTIWNEWKRPLAALGGRSRRPLGEMLRIWTALKTRLVLVMWTISFIPIIVQMMELS